MKTIITIITIILVSFAKLTSGATELETTAIAVVIPDSTSNATREYFITMEGSLLRTQLEVFDKATGNKYSVKLDGHCKYQAFIPVAPENIGWVKAAYVGRSNYSSNGIWSISDGQTVITIQEVIK